MAAYEFLTTWLLEAPREAVWDAIHDQVRWPDWWRGVEEVKEVRPGEDGGLGSVSRMVWKSLLPYRVEFQVTTTHVERPRMLQADAVGELAGLGRWRLFEEGEALTAALYEWNVDTTKPWMNLIAPVARPVFEWNHDWVMSRGGEGIAALLGCRLLASG
jgi:uncharacterized protein YndB with AHSA1/START domain